MSETTKGSLESQEPEHSILSGRHSTDEIPTSGQGLAPSLWLWDQPEEQSRCRVTWPGGFL